MVNILLLKNMPNKGIRIWMVPILIGFSRVYSISPPNFMLLSQSEHSCWFLRLNCCTIRCNAYICTHTRPTYMYFILDIGCWWEHPWVSWVFTRQVYLFLRYMYMNDLNLTWAAELSKSMSNWVEQKKWAYKMSKTWTAELSRTMCIWAEQYCSLVWS